MCNVLGCGSSASTCSEICGLLRGQGSGLHFSSHCVDASTFHFLTLELRVSCIVDGLDCWLEFFLRLSAIIDSFLNLLDRLLGLIGHASGAVIRSVGLVKDNALPFVVREIFFLPPHRLLWMFIDVWDHLPVVSRTLHNLEYLVLGASVSFRAVVFSLAIARIVSEQWLRNVLFEGFACLSSAFFLRSRGSPSWSHQVKRILIAVLRLHSLDSQICLNHIKKNFCLL